MFSEKQDCTAKQQIIKRLGEAYKQNQLYFGTPLLYACIVLFMSTVQWTPLMSSLEDEPGVKLRLCLCYVMLWGVLGLGLDLFLGLGSELT